MFQFTHPGKGATSTCSIRAAFAIEFQFTHPGKGATGLLRLASRLFVVSIHAPWEGCDIQTSTPSARSKRFNSRTLGRVRRRTNRMQATRICFNSRTLGRVRRIKKTTTGTTEKFQFTHPGKGATPYYDVEVYSDLPFQFTHPGKGATILGYAPRYCEYVSIHAPWEGCDDAPPVSKINGNSFNSRTLGRVRQFHRSPGRCSCQFQFTHPGKGATSGGCSPLRGPHTFQFTHPGKGATIEDGRLVSSWSSFNSRTLGRVRRISISQIFLHLGFNSRTLGRVRHLSRSLMFCQLLFQFTHPGKGATKITSSSSSSQVVSIHAPWEGCDRSAPYNLDIS